MSRILSIFDETANMYKLTKTAESRCLQCGAPINGRPDKKFCDSLCRNAYHNREAESQRRYHNFVLETVEINYAILKEALGDGKRFLDYYEAVGRGFNPNIITGYRKRYRKDDYFVFDIIYNRSDSRIDNIHRAGPVIQSSDEVG